MKVYTIIGGVNGTGKSSLTGVLRAQRNDLGVIVDVDRITALAGVSPLEGGKMAIRRIDDCLDKGISFTQESTLSGFRTAQTAARAKRDGYTVRLFYVGLDTPEESLARIAAGITSGQKTSCAVLQAAGRPCRRCCRSATRHIFLTTTTALSRSQSTETASCCLSAIFALRGCWNCSGIFSAPKAQRKVTQNDLH